jgi:hypothetical protein
MNWVRTCDRSIKESDTRQGRVTTKTLRLTIIAAPARLVRSARQLRLRLPTHWPWANAIRDALNPEFRS